MTARVETRYLAPKSALCELLQALGPDLSCLTYRVTNHYLDNVDGAFTGTVMGSPRLRLRLYESAQYVWGQLQRKRQVAPSQTEKDCWPAREAWPFVLRAMPWLADVDLDEPSDGHALAVLQHGDEASGLELGEMSYVAALSYRRLSFLAGSMRITADWDFEPRIVAADLLIVETKSEPGNERLPHLERLDLQPLAASKFALMQRQAA